MGQPKHSGQTCSYYCGAIGAQPAWCACGCARVLMHVCGEPYRGGRSAWLSSTTVEKGHHEGHPAWARGWYWLHILSSLAYVCVRMCMSVYT